MLILDLLHWFIFLCMWLLMNEENSNQSTGFWMTLCSKNWLLFLQQGKKSEIKKIQYTRLPNQGTVYVFMYRSQSAMCPSSHPPPTLHRTKKKGFKEYICWLFQTTFFFDVHKSHFHKALDMFAQFFISPLFLKTSVDREIMAVDNGEHDRGIPFLRPP